MQCSTAQDHNIIQYMYASLIGSRNNLSKHSQTCLPMSQSSKQELPSLTAFVLTSHGWSCGYRNRRCSRWKRRSRTGLCLRGFYMVLSGFHNGGYLKWMVDNGKSYWNGMMTGGTPMTLETSILLHILSSSILTILSTNAATTGLFRRCFPILANSW